MSDVHHPIIQEITSVIAHDKPDFCILEGFYPEDGLSPKRVLEIADLYVVNDGICPENLWAAKQCAQRNIPFIGGDVHNAHYLELEKQGYSEKDIVFWMLAQNFPFWNRDGKVNDENFNELATDMIQTHITFWLNKPELHYTVGEFLAWHEAHMGKPLDVVDDFPWGYDRKEWMPSLASDATIYQRIQAHIMPLRDCHIVRVIYGALAAYDTVVVIFGASHYEWQKPVLEKLFNKPVESYVIG